MKAYGVTEEHIFEVSGSMTDNGSFRCLSGSKLYSLTGYVFSPNDWFITKDAAFNRFELLQLRYIRKTLEIIDTLDKKNTIDIAYYEGIIEQKRILAREARDMNERHIVKNQ